MPDESSREVSEGPGSLGSGVAIGFAWNAAGVIVSFGILYLNASVGGPILAAIGLLQLIWIVPVWFLLRNEGKTETAKGILVGITFLLNAACWGLVALSLGNYKG